MFGFSKKRVMKRMEAAHIKLTVLVYSLLKDKILKNKEYNSHLVDLSESDSKNFVGALTNFLFGRATNQEHLDKFGYEKIKSTGYALLEDDSNLQEIIVQSLRVFSTLLSVESSLLPNDDGYEILEKYGKKFPDSPNPDSYESLITKSYQWMPESVLSELNIG